MAPSRLVVYLAIGSRDETRRRRQTSHMGHTRWLHPGPYPRRNFQLNTKGPEGPLDLYFRRYVRAVYC